MFPKSIEKPFVAICEGPADVVTFQALVKRREIGNLVFVCADRDVCGGFGKDNFFGVLGAITALRGFENVNGILILQDTDDNPDAALREMRSQVKKANLGFYSDQQFAIPEQLLVPATSQNRPPLMFATVPWFDTHGALETLVLQSLEAKFPEIRRCLDNYYECCEPQSNINEWSVSKRSKMRLAAMTASICKKDPTCAIQNMWGKDEFNDLMEHESFNRIADLFRSLRHFFKNHR